MFEFIVILCLNGEPDKCAPFEAVTDDCVNALYHVRETAPENAVVRALTCRRKIDMVLPPMKVTPDTPEPKETLRT